jgi:hypothetical protein
MGKIVDRFTFFILSMKPQKGINGNLITLSGRA